MSLTRSLLFFGIPGLAILLGIWFGVPAASARGITLIVSWSAALWLPIVAMLGWTVWRHQREGLRQSFRDRFWLNSIEGKHWIAIIIGLFIVQSSEILLSPTGAYLTQFPLFAPPEIIPELFDPSFTPETGLSTFFGIPVRGNWWLVLFWLGWLLVNIGGEELLWRGYALPLQERYLGKWAWLVNGLCWNLLVHAFMRWNVLTLMPVSLIIPFLVQRYRNIWIGIVIHGVGNALVLVILIPAIAGWT
ncbi:CPBP family intramembrane glutamic endopeptidase [Alterisphingorhabdus coralli]|uniref:CPBP family intramembrane glutamic endopeptidase n=1 Tax=Alterisphingorhabdus coralli TaxID=3071408 RepID=A0AA97F8L7_9SPHN|nr:CPBP family intramembrane glutamic endopeptidase [Parasphingorhabdus sp. SCSIO 66989]WOE76469.1 CPBP family intramembrane glutamic endopeptidase [Parasphingorhabdus sp. SCSIO 66989]